MKKKLLRRAVLALAAGATLIALFYVWSDWAGARRWKAVEAALRAKGEPLSIADIEPPPLADQLNFAAAPIFAELDRIPDSSQWRLSAVKGFVGASKAGASPLANAARSVEPEFAGTDADAARRILRETEKWRPLLDEVRAAAKRPGTAWPLNYQDGFRMKLNYISVLLKLGQALSAEAKADLELGDSASALTDFRLILDLGERAATPPLLINHLVRQSLVWIDISVLRYGLDRHQWNGPQLAAIQHLLTGISLSRSLKESLRGERVLFNHAFIGLSRSDLRDVFAMNNQEPGQIRWGLALWSLRPMGWSNEERSEYSEALQKLIEQLQGPPGPALTAISTSPAGWMSALRLPMARMALESIAPSLKRTLQAQTQVDQARIACALERYRLETHSLPPALDALVPKFLPEIPRDGVSGGPFHYRLLGPDRAVIYSVGWNQTDDGGDGLDPKHPQRRDSVDAPDWVWNVE